MIYVKILAALLIIGLFLYSKVLPHESRLFPARMQQFAVLKRVFEPLLNFLRGFIKPKQIGNGFALDIAQFVLLIVLLCISII